MAMAVVYTNFGGQIVHENSGGVERRYLADPLGSTIALTDSGTAITDTWDYWPYGEVMTRTGTNPTPFTFVGTLGYFKDLLDKLLYVRARHYQPNYGRWLTVDPLWPEEPAYGYATQRPIAIADPVGLGDTITFDWCVGWLCGNLDAILKALDVISLGGKSIVEEQYIKWLRDYGKGELVQRWLQCNYDNCVKDARRGDPQGIGILIRRLCRGLNKGEGRDICYRIYCKGRDEGNRDKGGCTRCCDSITTSSVRFKCQEYCALWC